MHASAARCVSTAARDHRTAAIMHDYAEVDIRWLPTAESGRATPVYLQAVGARSYRPHFRVGAGGAYLGIAFVDGEPPVAHPGDQGRAVVALIYVSTGVDYAPLAPGVEFEVIEGPHLIGRGTVRRRWSSDADWRAGPPR
jgi:hypothetical protein